MQTFGPRALTQRDGWNWLIQAWRIMWQRPSLFLVGSLLTPTISALLLFLPIWELWLPLSGGLAKLLSTVFCYGLPLSLTLTLACGLARATNCKRGKLSNQLLNRTATKALLRTSLFLFLLILQGYLLVYCIQDILNVNISASSSSGLALPKSLWNNLSVNVTILETQLSILGSILLICSILLAMFVIPLKLFQELPLSTCWQRSALAMHLNPWLSPMLFLTGFSLFILPFLKIFSICSQLLSLPLPVYLGVLLYVAWNDVFQGDCYIEEEKEALPVICQEFMTMRLAEQSIKKPTHVQVDHSVGDLDMLGLEH